MNTLYASSRGARLLDGRIPGWADLIDTERLQMDNGCDCVLGQLFSFYETGIEELFGDDIFGDKLLEEAVYFGFNDDTHSYSSRPWTQLNNAWIAEIEQRRGS